MLFKDFLKIVFARAATFRADENGKFYCYDEENKR